MNIPPKYEDVVAQLETERARVTDYIAQRAQTELKLEAALGRETALREELETEKRANYNARVALKEASETCELWKGRTTNLTHANAALQQRLTVAEQWADELQRQIDILWKEDKWSQEWKADKDFVFFANRHAAHDAHGNSFGWIDEVPFFYRQHCFEAFRAGVALKPAAEGEGS